MIDNRYFAVKIRNIANVGHTRKKTKTSSISASLLIQSIKSSNYST